MNLSNDNNNLIINNFEEKSRVTRILNLELSNDENSGDQISNSDAKTLFFQTLALPLQSVCRYVVPVQIRAATQPTDLFRTLKRIGGQWFVGAPWEYRQVDGLDL